MASFAPLSQYGLGSKLVSKFLSNDHTWIIFSNPSLRQFNPYMIKTTRTPMVLILYGNSEIDANVRRNLCYLICLRHLIRTSAGTKRIFTLKRTLIFYHACATCSKLPSNLSTMLTVRFLYFVTAAWHSYYLRQSETLRKK